MAETSQVEVFGYAVPHAYRRYTIFYDDGEKVMECCRYDDFPYLLITTNQLVFLILLFLVSAVVLAP